MEHNSLAIRVRRRRLGAIGAALLLVAILVSACGGSEGGTTSGGSGGGEGAEAKLVTTYGKAAGPVSHINWALPVGEPDTLDPPNTAYFSSGFVVSQLCDTLLRYEPDGTLKPGLAKVTQPDPTTIQIDLRKRVKFWDGTEMTSADVKYSLERAADPATLLGYLLQSVGKIDATDAHHVTVHLKEPDILPLKELGAWSGMIYEKKFAAQAGKSFGSPEGGIMCSGPYELKTWNPGVSIELTANPNYWDPQYKPHAKSITLKFFNETNSLANALSSGEVEGAYEIPPQAMPTLQKSSSGKLLLGPAPLYLVFGAARGDGPLENRDLRAALVKSIGREALAEVLYHGAAEPNYTGVNSRSWEPEALAQWEAAYKPYVAEGKNDGSEAALEEAKELVEKSGYDGTPVVYAIQAGDLTQRLMAQLVQQQAKEIGVNISIKQLTTIQFAEAQSSAKARQGIDLLNSTTFNISDDPIEPIGISWLPGQPFNYWEYDNPQVTHLLTQARRTLDPVKRAEMEIAAQTLFEKEKLSTSLLNIDEISFLNNRLSGMTTSFVYIFTPSLALIGSAGS